MLKSHTSDKRALSLAEYGRHVQDMITYCMTIADRAERQECAEEIIRVMSLVAPNDKGREDYEQVLWDHLYIMSGFALEIDYPYTMECAREYAQPLRKEIPYPKGQSGHRHYGQLIEAMIRHTQALPPGEERTTKTLLIAYQMKRSYAVWNNPNVDDARIWTDLAELSEGTLSPEDTQLSLPDGRQLLNLPNPWTSPKRFTKRRRR